MRVYAIFLVVKRINLRVARVRARGRGKTYGNE